MAELNPEVLKMAKDFMSQDVELEAFLTGPAGSGKSTELRAVIDWFEETKVNYLVVAYTHQAKEIIAKKLPDSSPVKTLHSWLKKRPGINEKAKHIKSIMTNHQMGKPEHLQVLVVDEFSFVGDDDYMSIGELQDELLLESLICNCGRDVSEDVLFCADCDTSLSEATKEVIDPIKVIYVGDLNQLSPIKGPTAPRPGGPFWVKLNVIHRTSTSIAEPLAKLVEMIEGTRPIAYLEANEHFHRGIDIDKLYLEDTCEDKKMYAYTNKAVEEHNAKIQGYKTPIKGDIVYVTTLRESKTLVKITDKPEVDKVLTPNGEITEDTKYSPLQFLTTCKYIKFFHFDDGSCIPGIFGSYQNKLQREKLGKALVEANKSTKGSRKEYREYKAINDFTCIIDFDHCMTVHKSQGSEAKHVYVDSKDIAICKDLQERMKLTYVGMSRSKDTIWMSN